MFGLQDHVDRRESAGAAPSAMTTTSHGPANAAATPTDPAGHLPLGLRHPY